MHELTDQSSIDISISVVSHAQIDLISELLKGLEQYCLVSRIELILTLNVAEILPFSPESFAFPIKLVKNQVPLGFGANHNRAFSQSTGRYFCVINPDIRLNCNPFSSLLACMDHSSVGVIAPKVLSENGLLEDSARRFPTPLTILRKFFGRGLTHDYEILNRPVYPDWIAGMFMLYPRDVFERLRGFDERYFLYYEDVDICARLRLLGYQPMVCPQASVAHHAQRHSHGDLGYLRWHLRSMLRFFLLFAYWRVRYGSLLRPVLATPVNNGLKQ